MYIMYIPAHDAPSHLPRSMVRFDQGPMPSREGAHRLATMALTLGMSAI
jgi:hypothetical protein